VVKATKRQAEKKSKNKGRAIRYGVESEKEVEEEVQDEIVSDLPDCSIVDVE
jgi:hypothetical protein